MEENSFGIERTEKNLSKRKLLEHIQGKKVGGATEENMKIFYIPHTENASGMRNRRKKTIDITNVIPTAKRERATIYSPNTVCYTYFFCTSRRIPASGQESERERE